MRIVNGVLIEAPVDWTTTWLGPAIGLSHIANFSIQLVWTGSCSGTLSLQVSNDSQNQIQDGVHWSNQIVNWTDVLGSEQLIVGDSDHTWQGKDIGCQWIRALYVPSSGSPTLQTARFVVKGI